MIDNGVHEPPESSVAALVGPEPDEMSKRTRLSPLARRQRMALVIAVTAAVLSTGGLLASTLVKSPQQQLAETAPPNKSVISAAVERRVLASTVVTRGRTVSSRTVEATPASSYGAQVSVVTGVRTEIGSSVKAGDVVVTVSGRPLIVLLGPSPAYRDLKPGLTGDDVTQLQDSLRGLGYPTGGDRQGYFGSGTKAAVQRFYRALGFEQADTGGPDGRGDLATRKAAEQALADADLAVTSTKSKLAAAVAEHGTNSPEADALRLQLTSDEARLKGARTDLTYVVEHSGTMVPLSEVVFVPTLPARVVALGSRVGEVVKSPLVTIASGQVEVSVELTPDQANLVKVGMVAQLSSESLGEQAKGTVSAVGARVVPSDGALRPGGGPGDSGLAYHPASIVPDQPLPATWTGLDIRVTFVVSATDTPVLVVPISAIFNDAAGKSTVSVLEADANVVQVGVRVGLSGNGFVAVEPVEGSLSEGDRVLVGSR